MLLKVKTSTSRKDKQSFNFIISSATCFFIFLISPMASYVFNFIVFTLFFIFFLFFFVFSLALQEAFCEHENFGFISCCLLSCHVVFEMTNSSKLFLFIYCFSLLFFVLFSHSSQLLCNACYFRFATEFEWLFLYCHRARSHLR